MSNIIKTFIVGLNHLPIWRIALRCDGVTFHVPSFDRLLYLWLHRLGISGTSELKLLRRLVAPGDVVLDVGANIGLYSAHLAACAGASGRVYSFEPVPGLFECLEKTVKRNSLATITLFQAALGDSTGSVTMEGRPFNSGDYRVAASEKSGGGISVPVRRGDDLLTDVPEVHVLKIDVQGYEIPALRGLRAVLSRSPRVKIVFEYWPEGMQRAGFVATDLIDYLREMNMVPHIFDAEGTLTEISWSALDAHCIQRPWGRCGNFVAARAG